jgi:hypothetical protein
MTLLGPSLLGEAPPQSSPHLRYKYNHLRLTCLIEWGVDWRQYSPAFNAVNATGWYRQSFTLPPAMANTSAPITLSLGIVAGADMTYLNGPPPPATLPHLDRGAPRAPPLIATTKGRLLGTTPAASRGVEAGKTLSYRDYITTRAYVIPPGFLNTRAPNTLAVRVVSYGGAGTGPANSSHSRGTFPGGLYDDPNLSSPLLPQQDLRVGPFDAAASPGQQGTGYTLGGRGAPLQAPLACP